MKECVRGHLSEAVCVHEDRPREQWILDFPAQVALTGSQIWWNNDMELVFKRLEEGFESALKDYNKKQVRFTHLSSLPGMTCSLFGRMRADMTNSFMRFPIVCSNETLFCLHVCLQEFTITGIDSFSVAYLMKLKFKNDKLFTNLEIKSA